MNQWKKEFPQLERAVTKKRGERKEEDKKRESGGKVRVAAAEEGAVGRAVRECKGKDQLDICPSPRCLRCPR